VVWHIWWLAIAAALGLLATVVVRSFSDDPEYVLPAAEVERIENERFHRLAQAPAEDRVDAGLVPQPSHQV
jgi:cytochrome o ubiquinol oxidase subunit I